MDHENNMVIDGSNKEDEDKGKALAPAAFNGTNRKIQGTQQGHKVQHNDG